MPHRNGESGPFVWPNTIIDTASRSPTPVTGFSMNASFAHKQISVVIRRSMTEANLLAHQPSDAVVGSVAGSSKNAGASTLGAVWHTSQGWSESV
jgi:hypothetical protein